MHFTLSIAAFTMTYWQIKAELTALFQRLESQQPTVR
jgi:hypothetical protein